MTIDWIIKNLPIEDGKIILNVSSFGSVYSVDVGEFANRFANVEPTYEELVAFDEANNLGYKPYLDAWKQKGILS